MAIERLTSLYGSPFTTEYDMKSVLHGGLYQTLRGPNIRHSITPRHLIYKGNPTELVVGSEGGVVIFKDPQGKPTQILLQQEGDAHFIIGEGKTPSERLLYAVVFYRRGVSPAMDIASTMNSELSRAIEKAFHSYLNSQTPIRT